MQFNAISFSAPFVCLFFVFVVYCLFCPLEDVHPPPPHAGLPVLSIGGRAPPPRELSTHDFFQPTSNGAICDESVRENLAGLLPKVRRLERDNLAGPLPKSVTVAGCRIALRMYSYDLNRGDRTNFSHLTCSESHVLSLELTQRSALQHPQEDLRGNY